MGGGAGYGAGKAVQSIVNMFRTPTTPPGGQTPPPGGENTPGGDSAGNLQAPPGGEAGPPEALLNYLILTRQEMLPLD